MIALASRALGELFSVRARRELLFCLAGVLIGLAVLAVLVALLAPGTARSVARAGTIVAVLLPLALATGTARKLGAAHRRLAQRQQGRDRGGDHERARERREAEAKERAGDPRWPPAWGTEMLV